MRLRVTEDPYGLAQFCSSAAGADATLAELRMLASLARGLQVRLTAELAGELISVVRRTRAPHSSGRAGGEA